ncbi:MAG: hypothetical protein JWM02_1180 [Frankiales bacterium]|nr:hypothetical protein [Frankiales bacterium]
MGRASRRRSAQRASVTAKVFSSAPRPRTARSLPVPWPLREGLEQLGALQQTRAELDGSITALVHALTAQGASWGDVGRALGLTRQGAGQRYATRG